ncbi:MAG: hypothetical protein CMJ32_09200 [Phycisphaerae bacterium]|nr:hypothetical protein [Phycisphaerae bacterium]
MSLETKKTDHAELPQGDSLIGELAQSFRDKAESVVPWFLSQMPKMYFQDTDHETQLSHLRAIIAAQASGQPLEMTLRSEDGDQWTCIRPTNYPGVLAEMVASLPEDRPLRAAKIHTTADKQLILDTFRFGYHEPFDPNDPEQAAKLEQTIQYAATERPHWSEQEIRNFFACCTADYVQTLTPLRICRHHDDFMAISRTDGARVCIEPEENPNQSRITITVGNASTRSMLERAAILLSRYKINIDRAYLDMIEDPGYGSITIVGFVAQAPGGVAIDSTGELWTKVAEDLTRIKWVDVRSLDLAGHHEGLELRRAECLIALSNLVHHVLNQENPYAFTRSRIRLEIERSMEQALEIVKLFESRFNPASPMGEVEFIEAARELHDTIERRSNSENGRIVLHRILKAVEATYRTNYYLKDRFALSFRIDPAILRTETRTEIPYGVFFVHGRGFDGFHVRFRDIARGGLRVIRTFGEEQHGREVERLYDEAYGLAFAQQLKNKDIPEGGAKAAILLRPNVDVTRSVKAFVDSILDLITPDQATRAAIVDRFGQEELLYLGPDENITPQHIEWIADRAQHRGYAIPSAFISSKPGAGINHKVYGVTSEGVNVFLDVALRHIGINPDTQPFTIKITGGPDGDVAGNMIKILHREYGENAKIIGIADGSGTCEDPAGLDYDELLRLVKKELPIMEFDSSKLSPNGRLIGTEEPEGVQQRNTMHNRVYADAFVPAGGRPATIHANNWREFLQEDGTPSSKVIVEGANLFLTPEARAELSNHGVLIIKDSSANKCGVICSSYEIAACMLLDETRFLQIKETFVEQVLQKLRSLAKLEAILLMGEQKRHPEIPLPETSVQLSRVINDAAVSIEESISSWSETDRILANALVAEHMPEVLVDEAEQTLYTLPKKYLDSIIAYSLSAGIAYREGIGFLEDLNSQTLSKLALDYLRKRQENCDLVEAVLNSNLHDKERVATLLARGGIRAAMQDI